jgi:mRNA-degrading endonuclease toxin of MazEF toxin-antitoxin module
MSHGSKRPSRRSNSGITPRMPSTTSFSQGDVVLVPFPFTDLSAVKQRPALVLSPDRLNKGRIDVIVAAITSQIPTLLAKMTFCYRMPIGEQLACPKRR